MFDLASVETYTDEDLDWTDNNSRVTVEHENPEQGEALVSDMVENRQGRESCICELCRYN